MNIKAVHPKLNSPANHGFQYRSPQGVGHTARICPIRAPLDGPVADPSSVDLHGLIWILTGRRGTQQFWRPQLIPDLPQPFPRLVVPVVPRHGHGAYITGSLGLHTADQIAGIVKIGLDSDQGLVGKPTVQLCIICQAIEHGTEISGLDHLQPALAHVLDQVESLRRAPVHCATLEGESRIRRHRRRR